MSMKNIRIIIRVGSLFFLYLVLLTSCRKDDERPDYSYFISKEFAISYKTGYINNLLDIASGTYPEIDDLKPFVSSDVNVYKVIYNTNINDKDITASGLVCVPTTSGEYPVLCFQNGTNTVNSSAPSEYVISPLYQLVELIASMGYIVVIPDYPGFGESAQVAHPYLVAGPTVGSIVDMLFAVKELGISELPGITIKNEFYLLGYSQGGWATLALHKALEQEYPDDFDLQGSACGAGPYNLSLLFQSMVNVSSYPMPVYIGYIINAYKAYNQFTNPVTDILKEPYASRLSSLYTGTLSSDQINNQLTTSIPDLFNSGFITGFASAQQYASVREALVKNSVTAWNTKKPLYLLHGEMDTHVNVLTTENIYDSMIQAGTSSQTCIKEIIPGADHGDGLVPCMTKGLMFLINLGNPK